MQNSGGPGFGAVAAAAAGHFVSGHAQQPGSEPLQAVEQFPSSGGEGEAGASELEGEFLADAGGGPGDEDGLVAEEGVDERHRECVTEKWPVTSGWRDKISPGTKGGSETGRWRAMSTINVPRRLAAWATMAFAAAVLWVFTMPSYRQGEPSIAGKEAEDFAVNVGGKQARLSDFRGRLVVLNFWASYCESCVEEIPDLGRLQERIRSRGGVVLGVSVDENCGSYEDFLRKHPVAFQTVCEPTAKRVSLDCGTLIIPETYVIDRKGRIDRKIIGPQQWDSAEMMAYFNAALARN